MLPFIVIGGICKTVDGIPCEFPFESGFGGGERKTYTACTMRGDNKAWCNHPGTHNPTTDGGWGYCAEDCPRGP